LKKISVTLLLSLLLTTLMAVTVSSASDRWELVVDGADALTWEEWGELKDWANDISNMYQCDVAIVVIDEMTDNNGADEWAMFFYEEFEYGYGARKSGVLFFLSMAERDYSLIAYGDGNTAFTDYGKDVILDRYVLPLLKNDEYFSAFSIFLEKAEEFLRMADDGKPFDRNTDPDRPSNILFNLAVVILVPVIIAFIVCSIWKRQMKTAKIATTANNYIPPGGFTLTGQVDMFLYRTQTRTRIQSSSSSGGGTTTNSRGFSSRSGKF